MPALTVKPLEERPIIRTWNEKALNMLRAFFCSGDSNVNGLTNVDPYVCIAFELILKKKNKS
jgi:hypothetical protein